jgi:Transposase DDE domain
LPFRGIPNAKGDPLTFELTGAEAHEVKGYEALMKLHDVDPGRLLGDKGYDGDEVRADLGKRGIQPVIRPRWTMIVRPISGAS